MSAFLTELIVQPYPNTAHTDGKNWRLCQPLSYQSDSILGLVTVPTGFLTDFASTPQAVWTQFPPWGTYGPAAVVHDWLYWSQPCSRDQADAILLEAMHALEVDSRVADLIYEAVRLGGQHGWSSDAVNRLAGKEHVS